MQISYKTPLSTTVSPTGSTDWNPVVLDPEKTAL